MVEARGVVHNEVPHQYSLPLEAVLSAADDERQSVQEHLSHFQKILTNLLSIGEKVEEKIRMLILLASLSPSYESLMTALLVGKSTIKMDKVTIVILQNEILRRENPASSLGSSLALMVLEEQEVVDGATENHDKGDPSLRQRI